MILQSLVDYTNMERIVGCILDNVYIPSVSMKDSIEPVTLYFHTSMVVYQGFKDHLQICNLIHGNMLSLSLKNKQNGKVSLNNSIRCVDYKMTVNMLMKHLYISIQYFISLIYLFLRRLTELSTSQPKL